jgi:hypothetical protein
MPTKHHSPEEREAFCHSCPDPEEVKTFLKQFGLRLDFQMEACAPPLHSELSALPAQFHFADDSGMSLIYLAGEDTTMEVGERLPIHKSRFWAYGGAAKECFERITQLVALRWSFTWCCPAQAQQDVA